jgi:uncharacterized protein (DUF2141 family)
MFKYLKIIALWVASSAVFAETAQLEITVTNINQPDGTMFITIFKNPDNWLGEEAFLDLRFPVTSEEDSKFVIPDIPPGTYAVSIFHDLNGNLDIDTNFIGIPKEPYGFSGEVGKFGPPKFDKASFVLESGTKELEIKLN